MIRDDRGEARRIRPIFSSQEASPFNISVDKERRSYHIERHNMFERDFPSFVAPDQGFVDDFRAASSWKANHEWIALSRLERFDATLN